jgi:hypothetical protein
MPNFNTKISIFLLFIRFSGLFKSAKDLISIYRNSLKINAASEPRNFKLMHAVKLKFIGFNTPYVIAASKPKFNLFF